MNVIEAGALNLAGFVRATAGRIGSSADVRGGTVIAGPIPVPNGYVTTAIPTDLQIPAKHFFDDACGFFASLDRPFVMWVPSSASSLLAESTRRGLVREVRPSPAMVVSSPVREDSGLRFRLVDSDESGEIFGRLCERGYEKPGMALLMAHQQGYSAPNSYWYVAFDGDDIPVSAACAYQTGDTGGIYSVATPSDFRGRGFAAAVTAFATNHLFGLGVERVVLQASELGFGVYQRLGFSVYDHFERFTIAPS